MTEFHKNWGSFIKKNTSFPCSISANKRHKRHLVAACKDLKKMVMLVLSLPPRCWYISRTGKKRLFFPIPKSIHNSSKWSFNLWNIEVLRIKTSVYTVLMVIFFDPVVEMCLECKNTCIGFFVIRWWQQIYVQSWFVTARCIIKSVYKNTICLCF